LAITTLHNIYIIRISAQGTITPTLKSLQFEQSDINDLTVSEGGQFLAFSTRQGTLTIVDTMSNATISRESVCRAAVNNIVFSSDNETIGYACQDGAIGVRNFKLNTTVFNTQIDSGGATAASDSERHYWAFGGNNGTLLIYDLQTRQLSRLFGHAKRITSILLPSSSNHHVTSSDSGGNIIQWPQPSASIHVAIESSNRLIAALLLPNSNTLLASGSLATSWTSLDGLSGTLEEHDPSHYYMSISKNSSDFAMYGINDSIELWSLLPSPRRHLLRTHHGVVTAVRYLDGTSNFISAGRDGAVIEWSSDGVSSREIGSIGEPIVRLVAYPRSHNIVAQGVSGKLSRLENSSVNAIAVIPETSRLVGSSDGRWLAAGTTGGQVLVYDTDTWRLRATSSFFGPISDLAFSSTGQFLVVADGRAIHNIWLQSPDANVIQIQHSPPGGRPWIDVPISARNVGFSRDGKWFAATCADGTVWMYSIDHRTWIATPMGASDIFFGAFSDDSRYFIATDAAHVRLIDMAQLSAETSYDSRTAQ
jgi:WD40 repeat protein